MHKPETTHVSDHDSIDCLSKTDSQDMAKIFNKHSMTYEMVPKLIELDNEEGICFANIIFST